MPSLANIIVNDNAATPVAHTFKPIGKPSGSDWDYFVERIDGAPGLQNEIRLRTRQPNRPGQPYRVDMTIIWITTKTVDGEVVVDTMNREDRTLTLARNGTEQERSDLRTVSANISTDAIFSAVVDGAENLFG